MVIKVRHIKFKFPAITFLRCLFQRLVHYIRIVLVQSSNKLKISELSSVEIRTFETSHSNSIHNLELFNNISVSFSIVRDGF